MTLQECYAAMGGDYQGVMGRLPSDACGFLESPDGRHRLCIVRLYLLYQGGRLRRETVAKGFAELAAGLVERVWPGRFRLL